MEKMGRGGAGGSPGRGLPPGRALSGEVTGALRSWRGELVGRAYRSREGVVHVTQGRRARWAWQRRVLH